MKFTLYKPNSKNTGAAFSFDLAKDKKNNAVMYVSMIQQHSWNDKTKSGSFKENAKNPEKSGTIKLSANEAGEILSSFKTRIPFVAFHRRNDDTTIIKFTPWDKKRKIMVKDGEQWHETPAFGVSVTRNSSMTFKLPLEAGETEVLSELLKKYILESFVVADAYQSQQSNYQSQKSNYQSKKPEEPQQEVAEDDDYGVPF
jgi:hypothetical protein|tara:strand:+ start:423 stop:1022 length:600 start_codon:yes stop_codon:yes gene_type:complete